MERLDLPITPRQLKYIHAIALDQGLSDEMVQEQTQNLYDKSVRELTRRDASRFIDHLMSRRPPTE
jgi:hypothetical protein